MLLLHGKRATNSDKTVINNIIAQMSHNGRAEHLGHVPNKDAVMHGRYALLWKWQSVVDLPLSFALAALSSSSGDLYKKLHQGLVASADKHRSNVGNKLAQCSHTPKAICPGYLNELVLLEWSMMSTGGEFLYVFGPIFYIFHDIILKSYWRSCFIN